MSRVRISMLFFSLQGHTSENSREKQYHLCRSSDGNKEYRRVEKKYNNLYYFIYYI